MPTPAVIEVPATQGRMGTTDFFTATLPFGAVAKLFTFDPGKMRELAAEERAQRVLDSRRVGDIVQYIVGHDDYVFSSVTVSVDANSVDFKEAIPGSGVGILRLPLSARYIVNDGQHRLAAIAAVLDVHPGYEDDTISVVVLPDGGLKRSQQIFSDLNRTARKTSKSLDVLYDHRLPTDRIAVACADAVPLFRGRIDKERVSLSVASRRFATLSGLHSSIVELVGNLPESAKAVDERNAREFAVEYWTTLTDLVEPWAEIAAGTLGAHQARENYVSSYALSLWALGNLGRAARAAEAEGGKPWQAVVRRLKRVDWTKENPEWEGICMIGREIITRQPTRTAMGQYLQFVCGLTKERPQKILRRASA